MGTLLRANCSFWIPAALQLIPSGLWLMGMLSFGQWWATLMYGQILPWRCAVVAALRPCAATLAGSYVWGDLPLSVRVYVHSYRREDVWRWKVAAPGGPHAALPAVATNRCHKYYDTEAIRSV